MNKISLFFVMSSLLGFLSGNGLSRIDPRLIIHADRYESEVLQGAVELIKAHEGKALKSYICPGGRKTIGYGHVLKCKQVTFVTSEKAEELLLNDVRSALDTITKLVKVKLTPNQLSALVSFVFNIGCDNFAKSKMLFLINQERHEDVLAEFSKWVFAKRKRLKGLELRREKEARLYANMDSINNGAVAY